MHDNDLLFKTQKHWRKLHDLLSQCMSLCGVTKLMFNYLFSLPQKASTSFCLQIFCTFCVSHSRTKADIPWSQPPGAEVSAWGTGRPPGLQKAVGFLPQEWWSSPHFEDHLVPDRPPSPCHKHEGHCSLSIALPSVMQERFWNTRLQ